MPKQDQENWATSELSHETKRWIESRKSRPPRDASLEGEPPAGELPQIATDLKRVQTPDWVVYSVALVSLALLLHWLTGPTADDRARNRQIQEHREREIISQERNRASDAYDRQREQIISNSVEETMPRASQFEKDVAREVIKLDLEQIDGHR